jgi:glycosyltransferase involved in cell wall biosynthesis
MKPTGSNSVFVVGPLPPPVHGASVITRSVIEFLRSARTGIVECNISPSATTRGWQWHASRVRAYARTLLSITAGRSGSTVYIALSGGNGLYYDLLVVLAVRLMGYRLVLHHHSFDYVDHNRLAMSLLLRTAPGDHIHLVLCKDMGEKLKARYRRQLNCVQVSNFCFFPATQPARTARKELRRIGFLSNISREKGIDRFLDVAERLAAKTDFAFDIAGPFLDERTRLYVEKRLALLPSVTYHGPLFGDDKRKFYDLIDAFAFLSRYPNEAEPLVVYEAMSAGLPVVATDRGCLCEMIDGEGAVMLDRYGDDIDTVVRRLVEWKDNPDLYAAACTGSARSIARLHAARTGQLNALFSALHAGLPAPAVPATSAEAPV